MRRFVTQTVCPCRVSFPSVFIVAAHPHPSRTPQRHCHPLSHMQEGSSSHDNTQNSSTTSSAATSARSKVECTSALHSALLMLAQLQALRNTSVYAMEPSSTERKGGENSNDTFCSVADVIKPSSLAETKPPTAAAETTSSSFFLTQRQKAEHQQQHYHFQPAISSDDRQSDPSALLARLLRRKRSQNSAARDRQHKVKSSYYPSVASVSAQDTEKSSTVPAFAVESAATWQRAITLFTEALQQHAVTPTAQHFNLLLHLTNSEQMWQQGDKVEAFYAKLLAAAQQLRREKELSLQSAREALLLRGTYEVEDDKGKFDRADKVSREEGKSRGRSCRDDVQEDRGGKNDTSEAERGKEYKRSLSLYAETRSIATEVADVIAVEEALRPNAQTFDLLICSSLSRGAWQMALERFHDQCEARLPMRDTTLRWTLEAYHRCGPLTSVRAERSGSGDQGEYEDEEEEKEKEKKYEVGVRPHTPAAASFFPFIAYSSATAAASRSRLRTNQRGPQLDGAAAVEAARMSKHLTSEVKGRGVLAATAEGGQGTIRCMWQEAYYNCFLPYRSFVEDVRTIWQMVNILHVAHQPQRVLDVFEEYRSKLLLRLASPGVATAAQPFALSEGDYGSPLLSMKDNNASVSSILEVSEEVAKEEARRQTLVAVGEAANELGRWDVALQLYEVAMGEWLRRCSCSVPRYYSNNVGAKGGAVAYSDDSKSYALHVPLSSCVFCSTVSSSAQSLLSEAITDANKRNKRVPRDAAVATAISPSMASLELVQQLLENALHTLRRVKRYAHVLELYHAWGGAAAVAAPERSVRGGIADDTLALLWTPRALGFVAQVALATDNVSLLLEMTGVLDDSDEGNHRNSRSYPRVGTATRAMIPVDVYDAALRAVQVRIARGELHKQQQQLGKKEKGIEDVKAAVVQAESGADWEVLSEKVYTKYLRDAINELHQKQQQQARVLATPVHAPLIRLVMNLQEEAAASCIHLGEDRLSLKRQHFHASQADAWQAALQHFHNMRHPDAILVTLTTDVLYRSAFSSSAAAARCLDIHTAAMNVGGRSPASQNSCWEAAFEVFNSLLKHAAPRGQRQGLATTHSSAAPSPSCVMDLTVVSAAAVQRGVRSASAHPYAALSLLQTAIMYCWLSTPAATNVRETMISSSGGGSGIAAQLIKELQDISMRHAKEDIATVEDSLLVADGATASKAPSCVIPFLTEAEAAAAATGRLVALLYTLYHQPQRHSVTPLARASATLSPPTAWGDVMSAAIQLMEQLREHGQPATAAMSQLLGTLHAAWRQCVKEEKEEEEKKEG